MGGTDNRNGAGEGWVLARPMGIASQGQRSGAGEDGCPAQRSTSSASNLEVACGGPARTCPGSCSVVEAIARELRGEDCGTTLERGRQRGAAAVQRVALDQRGTWEPCRGVVELMGRDGVLAGRLRGALLHQLERVPVGREVVCAFGEVCGYLEQRQEVMELRALLVGLRRAHGQGRVQEAVYSGVLDRAFGGMVARREPSPTPQSTDASGTSDAAFLRFLAGDLEALAHIVGDRARGGLLRYARRRWSVSRVIDAEDLVQETFLGVARCMKGGGGPAPETPVDLWHYLMASLNNCARRVGRKNRRVRECGTEEMAALVAEVPSEAEGIDLGEVLGGWTAERPQGSGRRLALHLTQLVGLAMELHRIPLAREIRERLQVPASTASRLRWDLVQALREAIAKREP